MNNNSNSFLTRIVNFLEHDDCRNTFLIVTRLLAGRLENRVLISYKARNVSSPKSFGRV